ncbi:MAG: hypothetical protein K8I00_12200 [Candidatus Omnitrophica bacterium]|nr:hypothetical protein [Candidatus Omnitrophota bacterium]
MNFTVYLFRDGEFYRRSVVNTPVFMGTNEVPLESFGMKDIFTGPHAAARWRIEISGGGDNPEADAVELTISADPKNPPGK